MHIRKNKRCQETEYERNILQTRQVKSRELMSKDIKNWEKIVKNLTM